MPMAIRWLFNSVFISIVAMILTCSSASLAGYALAKKRFWGRGFIFSLFVCAMALPKQVILIPLLREMSILHLVDTTWGSIFAVVFPVVGWPFGVFLMKQFSEGIPSSLLEAARIDPAHHPAGHRRTGHLHLHQRLERIPPAADHALQNGGQDHCAGYCRTPE